MLKLSKDKKERDTIARDIKNITTVGIRHKWRRLFEGLMFLVFVSLCITVIYYAPFFKVEEVEIEGISHMTREDVLDISGIYPGNHILAVKTDMALKKLTKDLRVENATIRRVFPSRIFIHIDEREPIASIACDYGYFFNLDREGLILDAYKKPPQNKIPKISGLKLKDIHVGDEVKDSRVQDLLIYLGALESASRKEIAEIEILEPEYVLAKTANGVEIRIGALERLDKKAQVTDDFIAEIKTGKEEIECIDLNYTTPFIKLRKNKIRDKVDLMSDKQGASLNVQ